MRLVCTTGKFWKPRNKPKKKCRATNSSILVLTAASQCCQFMLTSKLTKNINLQSVFGYFVHLVAAIRACAKVARFYISSFGHKSVMNLAQKNMSIWSSEENICPLNINFTFKQDFFFFLFICLLQGHWQNSRSTAQLSKILNKLRAIHIWCQPPRGRDEKTYKRAHNVCVKKILSRVKSLQKFTLICRESE